MEQQSIATLNIFLFLQTLLLFFSFFSALILKSSAIYYILADQLVSEFLAISRAFLDAANAGYCE